MEIGREEDEPTPLPIVLMTTNTTGKSLGNKVLQAEGDPLAGGTQTDAENRMERTASQMESLGFALDEFHHAFARKSAADAARMAMSLKTMVNSLQKPIIVMGTDGLEDFIDGNPELKQRFQRKVFFDDPRVSSTQDMVDLRQVLAAMQAVLPTEHDCKPDSIAMVSRLLVAGNGEFGSVVDMVRRACEFGANEQLPAVTLTCFCQAYRESGPRKLRADKDNPFLMPIETVRTLAGQLNLPKP